MFYHYKTKFGTFWIRPDPDVSGQFRLYIGRTWIGSYFSPESAAEDVYTKTTGFDEWDLQDDIVLERGEFVIIPRGVEHKPVAVEEVHVLLFEPQSTQNTGNVKTERTVEKQDWI